MLTLLGAGQPANGFNPASLSGPVGLWFHNEGSGPSLNRIPAARTRVNLLPAPENAFNCSVVWSNTSTTSTDSYATQPDAVTTTASRLQINAAATGFVQLNSAVPIGAAAGQYTLSLWVKSNTGSPQTIRLALGAFGTVSGDLAVTTSWTRITWTASPGATVNQVWIRQDSAANATDIQIWGMQLEAGASATTYQTPQMDIYPSTNVTVGSTGWVAASAGVNGFACSSGGLTLTRYSMYAVVKQSALNGSYGVLLAAMFGSGAAYANFSLNGSSTGQSPLPFYNGSLAPVIGSANVSKFCNTNDTLYHVLAATYDGTTFRAFIDGNEYSRGTASRAAPSVPHLSLGASAVGHRGTQGPEALYSEAHTTAVVRQMSDWLRARQVVMDATAATQTGKLAVFSGDSLSGNSGSWTETVATNLAATGLQFRNDGIGGSTVAGTSPANGARLTYVLDSPSSALTRKVIVVAFGTNDLSVVSGATFYASLKAYCQSLTAAGWRVVVCTTPSAGGTGSAQNTGRAVSNPLIVANAVSEGWAFNVADFASDSVMGLDSSSSGTPNTYYGDNLHPTAAGYALLAPYAQTAVAAALT